MIGLYLYFEFNNFISFIYKYIIHPITRKGESKEAQNQTL